MAEQTTTAGLVTWRPATAADAASIAAVLAAAESLDQTGEHPDADDIDEELTSGLVDLDRDTRVGVIDGTVVAFGIVQGQQVVRDVHRLWCWGCVTPSSRRRGIGRQLLDWQLDRARTVHEETHPGAPASLGVHVGEHADGTRSLAEAIGLEPVRHWFDMERSLHDELPEVVTPQGVTLEPFTWERDDEARRAHNAAFIAHFGSTERTEEEWKALFTGARSFRPDLSILAIDGSGTMAGYALAYVYEADVAANGRQEVWLGQIGTLPEHRGRGIGSALLASCLATWKAAGIEAAFLGVDSENATGALGLYERAGYSVARRSATWALAVPATTAAAVASD